MPLKPHITHGAYLKTYGSGLLGYNRHTDVANSNVPVLSSHPACQWLQYSRLTLRFYAYMIENTQHSQIERDRLRHVKIHFHLEDDTVEIIELRWQNSQMPQGTLLHRMRLPANNNCAENTALPPSTYLQATHFNVDQKMCLNHIMYHLVSCDQFTRDFLTRIGVRVRDNVCVPEDPYMKEREQLKSREVARRPCKRYDTLEQFLQYDRRVLRFWGVWDDTGNEFGEVLKVEVLYYLSDDSLEVKYRLKANSGRYTNASLLHRIRINKELNELKFPETDDYREILNMTNSYCPKRKSANFVYDSKYEYDFSNRNYYHDSDLCIGADLNINGRKITLLDCDQFTREYYRIKYERDLGPAKSFPARSESHRMKQLPDLIGFGQEEDTLSSLFGCLPVVPRTNFSKFVDYDRNGNEGNVLRFIVKLIRTNAIDLTRKFILSFYLSDDTLSVYEIQQNNDGIVGVIGKIFMGRKQFVKPFGLWSNQKAIISEKYKSSDLFVGAEIELNEYHFQLLEADEYTLNFMENYPEHYHYANKNTILSKVGSQLCLNDLSTIENQLVKYDKNDFISVTEVQKAVNHFLKCNGLNNHEWITLQRCYRDFSANPHSNMQHWVLQLRKHVQQSYLDSEYVSSLEDAIMHLDKCRTGYVCPRQIINAIRQEQSKLPVILVQKILNCMPKNKCNQVNYYEFLNLLNNNTETGNEICEKNEENARDTDHVNWRRFLNELSNYVVKETS